MANRAEDSAQKKSEELRENLEGAIKGGQIVVCYQPLLGSLSRKISALEALARWNDPERGTLYPDAFLPELEEAGLTPMLDLYVLRTAIKELKEMREKGQGTFPVSLNVSVLSLREEGIHETIAGILQEAGLGPEDIHLEIAESGKNEDREIIEKHFHKFHEEGYATFLDHFGEGKNSMVFLQNASFDYVKISMEHFHGLSENAKVLLSSFVRLVKQIGANVVAVGVESGEELDFLHSVGFGYLEGNYICPPYPSSRIIKEVHLRGYIFESWDDRAFFGPVNQINVLGGTSAFIGMPELAKSRQPVFLLALAGGRISILYENPAARQTEELSGRPTYEMFESIMNDETESLHALLISKLEPLAHVGDMDSYDAVSKTVKARMRVQLVSNFAGRRAYLIVGTDVSDTSRDSGDPGTEDYWRKTEKLEQVDPVTGLPSIRTFQQSIAGLHRDLQKMEQNAEEYKKGMWDLIYFDINQFAAYNQKYGFEAGNALLRELSSVILSALGTKFLIRYYSDHFYALAPDDEAETVVREVHDRMYARGMYSVSIHAGIYTIQFGETDLNQAIDRAKMAGESVRTDFNTYFARFEPWMEDEMIRSNYLVAHLDEAIEKEWIVPYLQPIGRTMSGKVAGFEALARWIDPQYGFLNPAEFIGILEDTHLIYKLDLYIIEHICRGYKADGIDQSKLVPISVNLSRSSLLWSGIHKSINAILDRYGVSRDLLRIEITESALVNDTDLIRREIGEFHRDGYQVWMDDFGSGYSSLGALHTFDFDVIKIDMMFLRHENEKTPVMLTEAVDLVRQMGAMPLVEGVETADQEEFLKTIGCPYIQGFYLAKPMPIDELRKRFLEGKLVCEEPEEQAFYCEVGKVNVLDPAVSNMIEGRSKGSRIPLLILEEKGDAISVLFMNREWQDLLHRLGYETDRMQILPENAFLKEDEAAIHSMLKRADSFQGNATRFDISYRNLRGITQVRRLKASGERRAFLLSFIETRASVIHEGVDPYTVTLEDMYTGIDEVEVIVPEDDSFSHVHGPIAKKYTSGQTSLTAYLDMIASRCAPGWEKKYLAFVDLTTLEERVRIAPERRIHSFFPLLADERKYLWRKLTIAGIPDVGGKKRYLFISENDMTGFRDNDLYEEE